MSNESIRTVELHGYLDRFRAGDDSALDALLTRVGKRLERLARKMIKRFPRVARWNDPEDVLQNASLRLIRSLREVRPESMMQFYALASTQLRRELLDMVKSLYGPLGQGANHSSVNLDPSKERLVMDPPAQTDDETELEKWCSFHEQVEKLPVEEREVVGLVFYHGWKQTEVADFFQVNVRTIQRWWEAALQRLQTLLSRWPIED